MNIETMAKIIAREATKYGGNEAFIKSIETLAKGYLIEAYNDAIETAAELAFENGEGYTQEIWTKIRELKK